MKDDMSIIQLHITIVTMRLLPWEKELKQQKISLHHMQISCIRHHEGVKLRHRVCNLVTLRKSSPCQKQGDRGQMFIAQDKCFV